jgi:hypothetical protein
MKSLQPTFLRFHSWFQVPAYATVYWTWEPQGNLQLESTFGQSVSILSSWGYKTIIFLGLQGHFLPSVSGLEEMSVSVISSISPNGWAFVPSQVSYTVNISMNERRMAGGSGRFFTLHPLPNYWLNSANGCDSGKTLAFSFLIEWRGRIK